MGKEQVDMYSGRFSDGKIDPYEPQETKLKYNWLFNNSGSKTALFGVNKEPYRHSLGVL